MFESIMKFLKKMTKKEDQTLKSKDAAKERLHLVLMQDRANVSADFLDLMKQEIFLRWRLFLEGAGNVFEKRQKNFKKALAFLAASCYNARVYGKIRVRTLSVARGKPNI